MRFDRRHWLRLVGSLAFVPSAAFAQQTREEAVQKAGAVLQRMSEGARRILFWARMAVSRYGGTSILPEHLLWGALEEMRATIDRILAAGWSSARLQEQLLALMPREATVSEATEIPFERSTINVIRQSAREADALGSSSTEAVHLLLAIVGGQRDAVVKLLSEAGLTRDALSSQVGH